ncbi:MAG: hypothetical protein K2M76_03410, partial [Muribaculaceae bacterium]|nr:hypothetical protein [Muribaculaceae bacterium]
MKRIVTAAGMCVMLLAAGCGGGISSEAVDAMRDSLQNEVDQARSELSEMNELMGVVTTGLDSLTMQEGLLFINNEVERRKLTRSEVRVRVGQLKDLLQRQRSTIAALTDSIKARNDNPETIKRLNAIIEFLNQQLDAKDVELQRLQTDLAAKNRSIEELQGSLQTVQTNVQQLEAQTANMTDALAIQDEVLNEAYVRVGTQKELKDAGLLVGGGFLKKSSVDYSKVDGANFSRIDIRKVTEIPINGKKPKILSSHPAGSYELKADANENNSWKLVIFDPTTFWKASNYLIIQT